MDGHLLRFRKDIVYTLLDVETFNLCLNFCANLPWQVGIIKTQNDIITEEHNLLVKWKTDLKIGSQAAKITNYSQEKMDQHGISPEEAFSTFWPLLEECDYLIMHNGLNFDVYLLKGYCEFMGKKDLWKQLMPKIIDTNAVAKGIKLGIPYDPKDNFLEYQYRMINTIAKGVRTSLGYLGKEFEINYDENTLHDALADLHLNLKIWNKLKYMIEL